MNNIAGVVGNAPMAPAFFVFKEVLTLDTNVKYLFMSRWQLMKLAHDGDRIARCCLIIHKSLDWSESDHPRGEGGLFISKGGNSSGAKAGRLRTDVTEAYLKSAKPGKGTVTMRTGYRLKGHRSEIETAYWLKDTFGGDVELIPEANVPGVKTPDMHWGGKNWELKDVTSLTSVDNAVRTALKQIKPGDGIIIRCNNPEVSSRELRDVIGRRIERSSSGKIDVMIIRGGELTTIIRYQKENT